MRARTLSGLSSFLVRSFALSGSRWPNAHWPSPRARRLATAGRVVAGTAVAVMRRPPGTGGRAWPAPQKADDVDVSNIRRGRAPGTRMRAASEGRTHGAAH